MAHMRNVWKGFIVGGLTGVVAGAVLDVIIKASEKAAGTASIAGERVARGAPEVSLRVRHAAQKAGHWLSDEAPERVRDAARKVSDSELADHAQRRAAAFAEHSRDRAVTMAERSRDLSERVAASARESREHLDGA